ncbi:MAG: dTMP kinase [Pseudomonadota bacterium]
MKSLFITIEGIEGVGKTTQLKLLEKYLTEQKIKHISTREPGGVPFAETMRKVLLHEEIAPMTELLLYEAARSEHFEKIVQPALQRGNVVICDRFIDATIAYQGYGRGIDTELIDTLNRIATSGRKPDVTFFIDIPVKMAFERLKQRGTEPDKFEKLSHDFYERVRSGYLTIHKKEPNRVIVIDGSGSPEATHKLITDKIKW